MKAKMNVTTGLVMDITDRILTNASKLFIANRTDADTDTNTDSNTNPHNPREGGLSCFGLWAKYGPAIGIYTKSCVSSPNQFSF
jgi:hypothetical protein